MCATMNGRYDMELPMTKQQTPAEGLTVRQYFDLTFPDYTFTRSDYAEILGEMPLNSTCGDSCRQIINAAWLWQSMIDAPSADDYVDCTVDAMTDITVHTCVVFIRG